MQETIVAVEDLTFTYEGAEKPAIQDVNFQVKKGEFVAIVGSAGAGKSTLCMCLSGLIPNFYKGKLEGSVIVAGLVVKEHSVAEMAQRIGLVFQDPETQLFSMTVEEDVAFGPENLGLPKEEIIERLNFSIKSVRLEELRYRAPHELSGGEKQEAAIASIIAMRPQVLVLDEPTSQLDPLGTTQVFDVVSRLNNEFGITVIVATQKMEEVAKSATRVILMDKGRIVIDGEKNEILGNVDLLQRCNLKPLDMVALFHRLKTEAGLPIKKIPLTIEDAMNILDAINVKPFKTKKGSK